MAYGEFRGTLTSSTPFDAGLYPATKATDLVGAAPNLPDYTTMFIGGLGTNDWIKYDMGAGGTDSNVVAVVLAARPEVTNGSDSSKYNLGCQPWTLQSSTDNSSWATRAAYNDSGRTEFIFHKYDNVIDVSAATAGIQARYWRILFAGSPIGNASVANFRLYGSSSGTLAPIPPTIRPSGGRKKSGGFIVTMVPATSSDSILYTTDDTNPTFTAGGVPTGTTSLYSAPVIVIPSGGGVTVRAVSFNASMGTTSSTVVKTAPFYSQWLKPNEAVYTTAAIKTNKMSAISVWPGPQPGSAQRMLARGGCAFIYNNYVYRVGFANDRAQIGPNFYGSAVLMYRSKDCINWEYVSTLCRTPNFDPTSSSGDHIERMHIRWNAPTSKWVMISKWYVEGGVPASHKVVFHTATNLHGPYTQQGAATFINGMGVGDQYFFTVGTAGYVIFVRTETDSNFHIAELASNWLSFTGNESVIDMLTIGREAMVWVVLPGGRYAILNSASSFYAGNYDNKSMIQTGTAGGSPLTATWGSQTTAYASTPGAGTAHDAQPHDVVQWFDGSYIFFGDHWSATDNTIGYDVISPMTVTSSTLQIGVPSEWAPTPIDAPVSKKTRCLLMV